MSGLAADIRGMWSIVVRDALITFSYRTRFLSHLFNAFFSLALFHFISRLVHVSSFRTADAYFAFAVIGLVTLQILNSTLQTPPGQLRGELIAGTFERILLSPLGAVRGMLAMTIFPLLYAVFTGMVMLIIAGLVFGVGIHWATLPLVIPVGILGTLGFAPFGFLFLALTLAFKQASGGATYVVAGISLIAGLYFPVSLLPAWMRWLSNVQPFTPAVDLLRHVMVGQPLHQAAGVELLKLAGFATVLLPISVWVLAGALRWGQGRGTVLEY